MMKKEGLPVMPGIKLGAQLYTVREFTQTPQGIEETLRKIKKMGFDVIQISAFGKIDPQRLAALVDELELDVCVTHTPLDRLQNELDQVIEEHRMLHCDQIGLGGMPEEYRSSKEGLEAFLSMITPIAQQIHNAGMTFAYHNHNFEFEKFDGKLIFDQLIEHTNPDCFQFILDTYWVQAGGCDPSAYIRKLKGRMKVCHFKDYAICKGQPAFAEIGVGNLDLAQAYRACQEAGVPYIVIEQDVCPRDPFDCLRVSYENLKRLAAQAE
ncbi:MAG TPA: sugar phosphate isomerase/epimerase [Candidatus Gallacutalibacter stercoravium]|nr:sugar phosphate isomerase/epimerase [Candidatus Gallacutalibacter stercoravium]